LVVLGLILLLTATTPWRYLRRPGAEDDNDDPGSGDPPSNFDLLPGSDQD
jgi:hypothetical protein